METEFHDLAYNHERIEYNSAAHIASIQSGVRDFFLSCRLAANLAFVALNMQELDFKNLVVPKEFDDHFDRSRIKAFKKNLDRGFAFVCMVYNGGQYEGDEDLYISNCLKHSKLGPAEGILDRACSTLDKPLRFSAGNEAIDHFVREANHGRKICSNFAAQRHYLFTLEMFQSCSAICPPIMDAEGEFYETVDGRISEYKPEQMHDFAHDLREYTRNLLTGCRGFEE